MAWDYLGHLYGCELHPDPHGQLLDSLQRRGIADRRSLLVRYHQLVKRFIHLPGDRDRFQREISHWFGADDNDTELITYYVMDNDQQFNILRQSFYCRHRNSRLRWHGKNHHVVSNG